MDKQVKEGDEVIYDEDGREQPGAQLVGFVGTDEFLVHLKRWGEERDVAQSHIGWPSQRRQPARIL